MDSIAVASRRSTFNTEAFLVISLLNFQWRHSQLCQSVHVNSGLVHQWCAFSTVVIVMTWCIIEFPPFRPNVIFMPSVSSCFPDQPGLRWKQWSSAFPQFSYIVASHVLGTHAVVLPSARQKARGRITEGCERMRRVHRVKWVGVIAGRK